MPEPIPPTTTLQGIQTLRFIAAGMVLLAHISNHLEVHACHLYDGWIGGSGVDIFFVISGYIMARIADGQISGIRTSLKFLYRRVVRIVPLYWLVTAIVIVAWHLRGYQLYSALDRDSSLARIVGSFLFIQQRPIVVVGWTLTYEFGFYLLFALCLLIPLRSNIRAFLVATLLAAIGIAVGLTLLNWQVGGMLAEFAGGMSIFYLTRGRSFTRFVGTISFVVGLVIFGLVWNDRTLNHGAPMWVAGACAIVFAFVALERFVRWPRPAIHLGDASYSLYLTHLYVVTILDLLVTSLFGPVWDPRIAIAYFATTVVASCVVASLSYRAVEVPLMRVMQRT